VDAPQRTEFISDYAKVVINTWHNPQFASELQNDTAAALASCGLTTQPGATFNIVRETSGSGDIDVQITAWVTGQTTGNYTLYIPSSQQSVQGVELAPQDQQALEVGVDSINVCTTCTPCCCCSC